MHNAVQDRVSDYLFANNLIPLADRQLGGDNEGSFVMPIFFAKLRVPTQGL